MKNKNSALIFIVVVLVIGGALGLGFVLGGGNGSASSGGISSAVSFDGDKQIINITAKGGYSPRSINARAGLQTILRVATNGTYDCSSSLVIPKLGYRANLDSTGVEEIAIAANQAQGTLQGLCGMGMYSFKVNFN